MGSKQRERKEEENPKKEEEKINKEQEKLRIEIENKIIKEEKVKIEKELEEKIRKEVKEKLKKDKDKLRKEVQEKLKEKIKEEDFGIPYPIFKNNRKEIFFTSKDFITQNVKQFAINICNQINLEKEHYEEEEKKQIISKLESAIKYDNTNEKIFEKYFNALKKFNLEQTLKNNLNTYFYHISPETYKKIENEEKQNDAIDKLKELFNLFESYDKTCYKTNDIISYFAFKNIKITKTNLNYNIKTNIELSLIDIYYSIYSKMALKIIEFLDIFKNPKLSIEKKIDEYIEDLNKEDVKELLLLNTEEDSIPIIFLSYSERFLNILNNIKTYVLSIKQVIDKLLKFTKLEQDYYILLFISLEIEYIIDKEKSPIFKDEILEYIKEPIISENNDIDSLKYKIDKIPEELKESLKKRKDYKKQYLLIPYLKLEYSNTNNYIYYNMKFIKQFNKKVSKSKTISSLLNYLFPGYTDFNLFEGEFMDTLFENAINNCYFYP